MSLGPGKLGYPLIASAKLIEKQGNNEAVLRLFHLIDELTLCQ